MDDSFAAPSTHSPSSSPPRFYLFLIVVLLLGAALVATTRIRAQETGSSLLRLQWATFDPREVEQKMPAGALGLVDPEKAPYQIVQFRGPIEEAWKTELAGAGLEPLIYIPDYAFVVRVHGEASLAQARQLPQVRWIGAYYPAFKLSPALTAEAASANAALDLRVLGFPGENQDSLLATLSGLGAQVSTASDHGWGPVLRLRLSADSLPALAQVDAVQWIEPVYPVTLSNDVGRGIMNVNLAWQRMTAQGVNLFGQGQIVGVADSGLDTGSLGTISADFAGRIVSTYALGRTNNWSDPSAHGTHVAGSVLGNGVNSGSNPATHTYAASFAGVAPEAQLVFQSLQDSSGGLGGIPDDLNDLFQVAYNDGARIHTNSWGGPTGSAGNPYGGYTANAQEVDQFTWTHQDMVILFAAGNEGTDQNGNGVIDPDSMASPGTAKNAITVGASENLRSSGGYNPGGACSLWGNCWPGDFSANPISSDRLSDNAEGLAGFSSRGPTDDTRIKPDIVAPGTNIVSVRSHGAGAGTGWGVYDSNYLYEGGTSMATPLTAGATALVRQWIISVRGIANPLAALVKAALINGAHNMAPGQYGSGATQEVPNGRPNSVTGWGRVDVAASVKPDSPIQIVLKNDTAGLATGGVRTYQMTINNAAAAAADVAAVDNRGGARPVAYAPAAEMLINGGFEQYHDGWTETTQVPTPIINHANDLPVAPHSGSYAAWLGGYHDADDQLFQSVNVSAAATGATLGFWYWSTTDESGAGFDYFALQIIDPVNGSHYVDAVDIDAVPPTDAWQYASYTLTPSQVTAIRGQTVRVRFRVVTDDSVLSSFFIDDVSFDVQSGPPATATVTPTPTATPISGGGPLRITLAWLDYPANPGTAHALVNDLDLEVTGPTGTVYHGNGGGSADRNNVIETVFLDNAPSGAYTVRVKGFNVPQGSAQPFGLVASGKNLTEGGGAATATPTPTRTRTPTPTPTGGASQRRSYLPYVAP